MTENNYKDQLVSLFTHNGCKLTYFICCSIHSSYTDVFSSTLHGLSCRNCEICGQRTQGLIELPYW